MPGETPATPHQQLTSPALGETDLGPDAEPEVASDAAPDVEPDVEPYAGSDYPPVTTEGEILVQTESPEETAAPASEPSPAPPPPTWEPPPPTPTEE